MAVSTLITDEDLDVEAVSLDEGLIMLTSYEVVTITKYLDATGSECGPDDADYAIAGPDKRGNWWTIDLSEYKFGYIH